MKIRINTIFYSFLVIFIATAIISLLGVTGVLAIDKENLRWLLGAFIIELGGAVIALFKNAPFFGSAKDKDIVNSLEKSVGVIDDVFPEMEAVNLGKAQAELYRQYGVVVRKERNDLVAYQKVSVIKGEDLEKLPEEEKEIIETNEKAMLRFRDRWKEKYQLRAETNSNEERQKIDGELSALVKGMKEEFHRILDILISHNMVLQDHYRGVRSIVDSIAEKTRS